MPRTCLIVYDALQDTGYHSAISERKKLLRAHQWIGNPTAAGTIELYRLPHPAWLRDRTRPAVRLRWLQSEGMAVQTSEWK